MDVGPQEYSITGSLSDHISASPAIAVLWGRRNSAEVTRAIWAYIKKKVRRFFSCYSSSLAELIGPRFHPGNASHQRPFRDDSFLDVHLEAFCCAGPEQGPHHQPGCHAEDDLPGGFVRLHGECGVRNGCPKSAGETQPAVRSHCTDFVVRLSVRFGFLAHPPVEFPLRCGPWSRLSG